MPTATQTLILVIEQFITKVGDDEGVLTQSLTDLKTQETQEEAEIDALTARVAALEEAATSPPSAPVVDLGPLTARVTALEQRDASDDAAAAAIPASDGAPASAPAPPVPPVIAVTLAPADLDAATVGEPYAALLGASGGTGPYAFSIASGALPDGLSLGAGGAITGTPTTAGTSPVGIQAHDANGTLATISYSLVVDAAAPAPEPEPVAAEPVVEPVAEPVVEPPVVAPVAEESAPA